MKSHYGIRKYRQVGLSLEWTHDQPRAIGNRTVAPKDVCARSNFSGRGAHSDRGLEYAAPRVRWTQQVFLLAAGTTASRLFDSIEEALRIVLSGLSC